MIVLLLSIDGSGTYADSSMDVDNMMMTQQLDETEMKYHQALNGFDQLGNWSVSDNDSDDDNNTATRRLVR